MKRRSILFAALSVSAALFACGRGTNSNDGEEKYQLATPVLTGETSGTASVTLTWEADPKAEYFQIHYGKGSLDGTGAAQGDSGEVLSAGPSIRLTGLPLDAGAPTPGGATFKKSTLMQFAVIAMGSEGLPSEMSNTVELLVPGFETSVTIDPDPIGIE